MIPMIVGGCECHVSLDTKSHDAAEPIIAPSIRPVNSAEDRCESDLDEVLRGVLAIRCVPGRVHAPPGYPPSVVYPASWLHAAASSNACSISWLFGGSKLLST